MQSLGTGRCAICLLCVTGYLLKTSCAAYLPKSGVSLEELEAQKLPGGSAINKAPFRETLQASKSGLPASVLATLFAKWIVVELNREGAAENKVYKLTREPTNDCDVEADQCQVSMDLQVVVCQPQQDAFGDCTIQASGKKTCIATFNMAELTLAEPVACHTNFASHSSQAMMRALRQSLETHMYTKKWGLYDGKPHPF